MFRDYIAVRGTADDSSLTAAEHIDTLTFCRIGDFTALSDHQKRTVLRVHERLSQWESENEDLLDSPLGNYSINGVAMAFDDSKIKNVSGVAIPGELYSMLCSTGLCYPAI